VELTSPVDWGFTSAGLAEQEASHTVNMSAVASIPTNNFNEAWVPTSNQVAITVLASTQALVETIDDHALYHRMIATVHITPYDDFSLASDYKTDPNTDQINSGARYLSSLTTAERRSAITPEILAKRWGIGLNTAAETLQHTTQEGVRNVYIPSERKVRKKAPWMKFPAVKGKFYADQMFSKLKSVHGHIGGTIYTNGLGYDRIYHGKEREITTKPLWILSMMSAYHKYL
jgi:hypothetical protein